MILKPAYCCLLLSCTAAAERYVISTYAGGAALPIPSPATAGSIGHPISVTADSAGNVYFASPDAGYVSKLDANGMLTRVAGTGIAGYSGDGGPAINARLRLLFPNISAVSAGLTADRDGNLFVADTGNHRVRRVAPDGTITTVAGNGTRGFSGDGGAAIDAQLNWPWALAVDSAGNLFISDALNYRVRKVSRAGIISTVAGGGATVGRAGDGNAATGAQISGWGIAADGAGNLHIGENHHIVAPAHVTYTPAIRKVSPDGVISTVAELQATPWGLAADHSGNVFVADGVSRIKKISADGTVTTVAGIGPGFSGDGGPAASAQLFNPSGIAVDGSGNLFIADRGNRRIRKVTGHGTITTVAGDGSGHNIWPFGGAAIDGIPATMSQLSRPSSVARDGSGNLFIADTWNNRVRKVARDGVITTIAGTGTPGFSGDGGPATNAQLSYPISLALDNTGSLFVLDVGGTGTNGGGRVRKIAPSGTIMTVAGNGSTGLSGDGGPATEAAFGSFWECNTLCGGIAVDSAGDLYIADVGNARVRKVSAGGTISTVAGNGGFGYSGDGGPATEAQLGYTVVGVGIDDNGNLLIATEGRIRKVSADGIISTVAGGGSAAGSAADGGPATSAQLSFPYALAFDDVGNLYFTDPGWNVFTGDAGNHPSDHRIRKISPDGIITTIAGTGRQDYTGDGEPAIEATLSGPLGLALDREGNIYVADTFNHAVRVLRPTGPAR